jgi:hypothetical protein
MADDSGWITPPEDHPVAQAAPQSAQQLSQSDSGWITPPENHPSAPPIDWSDKLGEHDALNYINGLPKEQQELARHSWADAVVHAHPESASSEKATQFAEYLPVAGAWLPRAVAAMRYVGGHSYEMSKALEEARQRAADVAPSTKLLETPFGDVYTSGLTKAAGAIAGTAALPMGRFLQGETLAPRAANMAINSGLYGAAEGAARGDTPEERAGNALTAGGIGFLAGPALSETIGGGARVVGAMRRYAGRAAEEAANPQLGADRQLNAAIRASGTTPEELQRQVVPDISRALANRGMTQPQINEFVRRGLGGESAVDLAKDYPLTASTIQRYLNLYKTQNPTALNMMDLTDLSAGQGAALPMTRAGRSAFIISRDGPSAEKIINRQIEQPGRVADIVQQSGGGLHFDERLKQLQTTLKAEEDAAYAAAKRNKTPVDIAPTLSKWRGDFPATGEAHNDAINNAIDLFYAEGYVPTKPNTLQQAQYNLAIRRLDRDIQKAQTAGDFGLVNDLNMKRTGLTQQLSGTQHTVTGPVTDVDSFLKQRRKLDDMIDASYQPARNGPGQQATNLTRDLTQFRKDINDEFRAKNPDYAAADDKFSGNRTTERLLNQGADMALTMKANRYLDRDFGKLTPSQQELMRVGFERNLAERALSKQEGSAVANQFQTPAFKQVVRTLYPKVKGQKGSNKINARGQALVQNLQREAATTRTKSNIFANSNTAQTTFDLADAMQGAYTAAHAVTGNFAGVFHDLGKWLARRIGSRQATSVIQTLSETDPAKMLSTLERLGQVAKNDNEAQIYRDLMRSVRRKTLERAIVGSGLASQSGAPPE